jgi:hypothetical protein
MAVTTSRANAELARLVREFEKLLIATRERHDAIERKLESLSECGDSSAAPGSARG